MFQSFEATSAPAQSAERLRRVRAKLAEWLKANLRRGEKIGFDPWLHTVGEIGRLREALEAKGLELKAVTANLVDRAWGMERPPPPARPIAPHPLKYAGR